MRLTIRMLIFACAIHLHLSFQLLAKTPLNTRNPNNLAFFSRGPLTELRELLEKRFPDIKFSSSNKVPFVLTASCPYGHPEMLEIEKVYQRYQIKHIAKEHLGSETMYNVSSLHKHLLIKLKEQLKELSILRNESNRKARIRTSKTEELAILAKRTKVLFNDIYSVYLDLELLAKFTEIKPGPSIPSSSEFSFSQMPSIYTGTNSLEAHVTRLYEKLITDLDEIEVFLTKFTKHHKGKLAKTDGNFENNQ